MALLCLLIALASAVYAPNLRDYFIADDFDLVGSTFAQPPLYFVRLLFTNEIGDLWKDWGLDASAGRGYLRPIQLWLMKLDLTIWGTQALGFHITATACFAAMIVCVFLILETLGVSRSVAFLAAWGVAIHPIFSAIVPYIFGREETASSAFGLAAFYFFLRLRRGTSRAWPVFLCYALALLTKEAAAAWVALPLGYDVIFGSLGGKSQSERRRILAFYGGLSAVVAGYLTLRWIAFGSVVGGDAGPKHYLSASAFVSYHVRFYRLLVSARLFCDYGVTALRWVAAAVVVAVLGLAFRRSANSPWPRQALFYGLYWYLCSTALFYGIYYDDRHHAFVIIGLGLLMGLATHAVIETMGRARRSVALVTAFAVVTAVWLPATLRNAHQIHEASRVIEHVRETIDSLTASLPDGSAVKLVNTPISLSAPHYFGWSLQSALRQPFTPSDCSKRLTIVDARDLAINHRVSHVHHFDLEIRFRAKPPGVLESVSVAPGRQPVAGD